MNMLYISYRNVATRPLSTLLTLIMLTMGVGLVSMLILVGDAFEQNFKRNIEGIDMVVGAKGSPLQLILSAVYHIDNPTGNISRKDAQRLARHPQVAEVIELSYGDSYKGNRIVGTTHQYPGMYGAVPAQGRLWEAPFEVTIGATIAADFGLAPGSTFYSAHGTDADAEVHEDHPYTVVGVLAPTGTVIDRLLLTSHESVWLVHETPGDTAAVQNREITAMLVRFKNKLAMMSLPRFVNQQTPMQAALPAIEINRLFSLLGMGIAALRTIAIAIMLLGAVSVFVSMVNSLRERIPEMAMLRSMGASRPQVAAMVLLEAVILALGGAVLGLATSRLGIWLLNTYASSEFGMMVDITRFAKAEALLVLATTILCTFAAMIPALKTGKMDISKVLSGHA